MSKQNRVRQTDRREKKRKGSFEIIKKNGQQKKK